MKVHAIHGCRVNFPAIAVPKWEGGDGHLIINDTICIRICGADVHFGMSGDVSILEELDELHEWTAGVIQNAYGLGRRWQGRLDEKKVVVREDYVTYIRLNEYPVV